MAQRNTLTNLDRSRRAVGPEGHLLRRASESIGEAPRPDSIGIDDEAQAATVESLVGPLLGLCSAQSQIHEGLAGISAQA